MVSPSLVIFLGRHSLAGVLGSVKVRQCQDLAGMPSDSWAHAAGADDVLLLVLVVVGGGHSLLAPC